VLRCQGAAYIEHVLPEAACQIELKFGSGMLHESRGCRAGNGREHGDGMASMEMPWPIAELAFGRTAADPISNGTRFRMPTCRMAWGTFL
jgi:hypothetical protein